MTAVLSELVVYGLTTAFLGRGDCGCINSSICRRLNWENKGVNIDGEFLSNLRFADDTILCTETPQELQQMLIEHRKDKGDGCRQHPYKREQCADRKCPRLHVQLKEKNQDKEIQRRIMAGWAAYAKYRDIFKSNPAICLNRQVYNSCVLPAMTYGAET